MKATVMESRNGKSVILTDDGIFRTVEGTYDVGSEFNYREPIRSRKMASRIAAVAACLMMALSMGTYSYQNFAVYATVTLSGITPIQLQLNRHDKVIGVKAVDEAGEALAELVLDNVKGDYLKDAVAKAEQMMKAQDKSGDNQKAELPKVQCKSPDKLKALTDILHQEETTGASAQEPSKETTTTTPSGTTAAETESEAGLGAQGATTTGSTTTEETVTQPSSGTEPSAEGLKPQEGTTESGESGEIGVQEAVHTEPAAEEADAPAAEVPADAGTPAEDAADAEAQPPAAE